jgi:hypothetical protein
MSFVVLWSDAAQASYCREVPACGMSEAIFAPTMKGQA